MNGAGQPPTQQWNFIDYDTLATFHQDAYSYGHRSSSSVNDVENIQMRMNELQARYSVNPYTMMEAWQYPRGNRRFFGENFIDFCRNFGKLQTIAGNHYLLHQFLEIREKMVQKFINF